MAEPEDVHRKRKAPRDLVLCRDNGKGNGNYYIRVIQGLGLGLNRDNGKCTGNSFEYCIAAQDRAPGAQCKIPQSVSSTQAVRH